MSRFTFHETDTLTSDLARLLQAQNTDAVGGDSTQSPAARRTQTVFPGIILLDDHHPCAAIGYTREPCETIVMSEPVVLLEATDAVYQALCGQMIGAVKRRAVFEGARRLHILIPRSAENAVSEQLLTELGFVCATEIVQWDLTLPMVDRCSQPNHSLIQLYDFSASTAASALEIQFALDAILNCSEDLSSQPHPTAAELLTRWQRMQAHVFVCRCEERIAGLITCVSIPILSAAATVPGTTSPSDTSIGIEYIGVVPAFRRRQIASLLIRQIPTLLSSICDARSPVSERLEPQQDTYRLKGIELQGLKVAAYSDAANAPANSLYQRCGFVQTVRRHLWCCDIVKAVKPE